MIQPVSTLNLEIGELKFISAYACIARNLFIHGFIGGDGGGGNAVEVAENPVF